MIPDWLIPVAQTTKRLEDSIFSFDEWKARFCLEQHCSLEQVIALSWRFKEELKEEEEKLAQKKAIEAKNEDMRAKRAQEKADKAASSKKNKGGLKKAGKGAAINENIPDNGNSGENVEKGNVDRGQEDIGSKKSPVVVERADDVDEVEREEMIPQDVREQDGVYEFDAKITDGAVMMKVQAMKSKQHFPEFYNCVFSGYRQREDGSMGYIEEHKLVRNEYDILIGLNGIHTRGWSFDKVLEKVKHLVGGKPECIITFTFFDFSLFKKEPRPTPSQVPNIISGLAEVFSEIEKHVAADRAPPAEEVPNAAADHPSTTTQVEPNTAADLSPPATQVQNAAANRPFPATQEANAAADHPSTTTQVEPNAAADRPSTATQVEPNAAAHLSPTATQVSNAAPDRPNPTTQVANAEADHPSTATQVEPNAAADLSPPAIQVAQRTPNSEVQQVATAPGIFQKLKNSFIRFSTSPKRTTNIPAVDSASETNPEASTADNAVPHSTNIAAEHSTTEQFNAAPSVTNKQPSGEPSSQTITEAISVGNSAQPFATEETNAAPNKQPSGEPEPQKNLEAISVESSAQPSAATLTDEVINNRQFYGFEVVKQTSLGLRLVPIFDDSSNANFYNSAFGGYHSVNNTEGYIEKHRLIRSQADVLVGINRVDLLGWPHQKVQTYIHNQINDRNVSTIHLTFMDALIANDLYLQQVTSLDSNKRKRISEEDSQLNQNELDEEGKKRAKSNETTNEATSDVNIEMASDEPVGVTNTNTPSEEELNTVVVHPAVRDIPEHTELFRWARDSHCEHNIRYHRPVEFTKYVYFRKKHEWVGVSPCSSKRLCFRWMCEHFKDDFIRQCIENANEAQDTPEFSQLYRGEKKIFRLMYDNKKKRWWGIFGQSIIEEVLQDWVLENFPEWFINHCLDKPNKKHYIHAGDAKTNMDLTVTGYKPPVFLQNGKHTCVFSSLASGLMHLNDKKASDFILRHTELSEEASDAIGCAMMLLTGKELRYSAKLYRTGMGALQIFDDISCFPTVVRVKSSDGSAGHCITIVGLWVFDSNKAEAEPLSYEFLDWCCSTDTKKDRFVAAHYAVRFFHLKPRKEWNLCEKCRNGKGKEKCIYRLR